MEASLNSPLGRTNLTLSVFTIGRAADNQMILPDQQASSHHAEIRPDAQGYLLVDLSSTNGTFVNEQRLPPLTPHLLSSGDLIRIGETRFTYEIAGSFDATMRAGAGEYLNQGYSPTVAMPPASAAPVNAPISQPDYAGYQQPSPSAPNYPQPPQAYPGYQPPAPFAQNYPQAEQPGYAQQPQGYPQPPAYPQPPQGYPQQQPWAGAPGQFAAPAAAAGAARPKKRRTGLIIGIVVLLLLVIGGGLTYYFVLRSTPEKTLTAVCNALTNSDAQGFYNQLSLREQGQTSVAKISQEFQLLKTPLIGGIKSCTFNNVVQNGSNATAQVTVTLGDTLIRPTPTEYVLVNENGTWKLDSTLKTPPSTPQ